MAKITIEVSDDRRFDILCGALSYCTYWGALTSKAWDEVDEVVKPNKEDCIEDRVWKALKAGKELEFYDTVESEDEEIILGKLSLAGIDKGEQIMADKYIRHLADVLAEEDDAATADVWLQCAILGDVVFG